MNITLDDVISHIKRFNCETPSNNINPHTQRPAGSYEDIVVQTLKEVIDVCKQKTRKEVSIQSYTVAHGLQ